MQLRDADAAAWLSEQLAPHADLHVLALPWVAPTWLEPGRPVDPGCRADHLDVAMESRRSEAQRSHRAVLRDVR